MIVYSSRPTDNHGLKGLAMITRILYLLAAAAMPALRDEAHSGGVNLEVVERAFREVRSGLATIDEVVTRLRALRNN